MSITYPQRSLDSHTYSSAGICEVGPRHISFNCRRLVRARLHVIALLGAAAAMTSIAIGEPVIGLAVCIATLAPLVWEA